MAEDYSNPPQESPVQNAAPSSLTVILRWLVVGVPLAWGIIETLKKSLALFH